MRERRAHPDDTILSALIAAEEEGDRLSSGEVVRMAFLLLIAGFETTVNLIGNGTVALLGDPDSWDRLRQDPALVPTAIEEMLRYDSPVQMTSRIATEEVELGDSVIPPAGPSWWPSAAPTATRRSSSGRTSSGSTGPIPAGTCPSRSACTTASAPRWPGWRAASPSRS